MNADQIEAIISRLVLVYGTRFKEQYGALKSAQIAASWRHELQDITPAQVTYALAHLPGDWPINALQFRDLARSKPAIAPPLPRLGHDGGVPTPNERRRLEAAIAPFRAAKDPKAWAHALRWREEQGERLSMFQRTAWRRALGFVHEMPDPSNHAGSSPITTDLP